MANKNPYRCPTWLDKEAKKEWKRIIKLIQEEDKELLEKDLKALEGYCQSYSRWKSCEGTLQDEGYTFMTPNGYIQQRPEISISNKAIGEMRAWSKELGLTPAARSRMNKNNGANLPPDEGDAEMEELVQ